VVLEIIVEMGQINRITLCFDVNWFRDCLEVMEVVSIGHRLGSGEHLSDQLFFLQERMEHRLLLHFDFLEITFYIRFTIST
jgi:hypothetical protein